jgi:hypothetical protein
VPSRSVSIPVPIDIDDVNEDTARDNHDYSTPAECDMYSHAKWNDVVDDFMFGDEKFFIGTYMRLHHRVMRNVRCLPSMLND